MVKEATAPCSACPWRRSNRGKPHPDGWYSLKNARRLWAGLRTGEAPGMTCHPTDPRNPAPPGARAVPVHTEPIECAGALLLVQRELNKFQADNDGYLRTRRHRGLSRTGLIFWAIQRGSGLGQMLGGGYARMPEIAEDPDVGFDWIES